MKEAIEIVFWQRLLRGAAEERTMKGRINGEEEEKTEKMMINSLVPEK